MTLTSPLPVELIVAPVAGLKVHETLNVKVLPARLPWSLARTLQTLIKFSWVH